MFLQGVIDHVATPHHADPLPTPHTLGAVLPDIHLKGAGADLTLLTTVGAGPIHLTIIEGAGHTLGLAPLTLGLQTTATEATTEAVNDHTHLTTQDTMIPTTEGIGPTLHMTTGMMTAIIEEGIDPTLHTILGTALLMIVTIEEVEDGTGQSLDLLPHSEGPQGGVFLAASHPNGGSLDGVILGVHPRDQAVYPSMEFLVAVILGARVQVLGPCRDQ